MIVIAIVAGFVAAAVLQRPGRAVRVVGIALGLLVVFAAIGRSTLP